MATKLERARMNSHLRAHGFGDLNDRTLLDQLAFVIRTHDKFKAMLMTVTPEERAKAYRAIAPRLSFKAKTLEEYVIEAKQEAENLPVYDQKTGAVTMPVDAKITPEMKQAITKRDPLVEKAEDAIAESIGQEKARGKLELFCSKCMFGTTVYAMNRADAYRTLLAAGWKISSEKAFCPDCSASPRDV